MSIIRAKECLKKFDLDKYIMEFDKSSATVAEAALAINCEEKEIAKTLSFLVGDIPIVIVVSGDSKIDNSKYKAQFRVKAKMIPFDDVERLIGHAVGGVCPFGVNDNVEIYLDKSLKKLETIYPACGSSNSAIKLTTDELEKIVKFKCWVDVCKTV